MTGTRLDQGTGIVATAHEASALPMPPLLVLDVVEKFLDEHGLGVGSLEVTRIGEGQSNVTYRIRREGADLVLRRGPRPPLPRSTHDMIREARVQGVLADQGFPVPRIRAVCEDESLLGVPFYVMDHLAGEVITDALPQEFSAVQDRSGLSATMVDTLAQLHAVDISQDSVRRLGRPEGYLERQVSRFTELWKVNTTREVPSVERLASWLGENRPVTQRHAVIHGDYRMGNLMFATERPARVKAVLDWEMATLGDPLADLGYMSATYAEPGEESTVLELTSVTRMSGFHTRDDLIESYARSSSLDLDALPWYQVMALWKAAIFCEAIYTRWLCGERPDDTDFASQLEAGVPLLLEKAQDFAAEW